MGKIKSIQFLRGLAAIAVVIFHACVRVSLPGIQFTVGAAGVDTFFVISGFIMWVTTAGTSTTTGTFLLHRAIRVIPLYWLVTITMSIIAVIAPPLFPHLNPHIDHVALSLLFVPHTAPDGTTLPVLPPGWTLNYEMFFYVLFAVALAARESLRLPALTVIFVALATIGFIFAPHDPVLSAYTNVRILEFIAGMWLGKAWLSRRLPSATAGIALSIIGVGAFAALALGRAYECSWWSDIFWGIPALLLVLGLLSIEAAHKFPDWKLFLLLGDASYSIYVLHHLTIAAASRLGGRNLPPFMQIPLYVAISAIIGCMFYRWIEKPMTARLRSLTAGSPPSSKQDRNHATASPN